MTSLSDRVAKVFEFDEGELHKDFRTTTTCGDVAINWEPTLDYRFVAGANHQQARTKDLVTALCKCVSALDKITSDPGFPIENNEAAIALRSNLLAHEALTALTAALEKVEGKIERSGK